MKLRRRFLTVAIMTACLAATLGVPPASAALKSWNAKVLWVSDGDTFDVDVNGDRRKDYTVRMIGLNTPEGHMVGGGRFSGQCNGAKARNRLNGLIGGKRIVLKAAKATSTGSGNRKLRFVHLRSGLDVNALMLREGLAVPYPSDIEPSRNERYIKLARAAAAKKRVIWNKTSCGYGPRQTTPLKVRLRHDANGSDESNENGEYVRIENGSSTALSLKNWVLRESSAFYYRFSDAAKIPAKGSVTVHTGRTPSGKTNGWSEVLSPGHTTRHYYWQRSASVFANERTEQMKTGRIVGRPLGDGAYLYDPHDDLRAYMEYPCLGTCSASAIGDRVSISVVPDAVALNDELVRIKNTSSSALNVGGLMVESWPWTYEITPGTVIAAGDTLTIHSGRGGTSSGMHQYWNNSVEIHNRSSDYIALRRLEGHVAKIQRW